MQNRNRSKWLALVTVGTLFSPASCYFTEENSREFRDAVGPGLETGIGSILSGDESGDGFSSIITSLLDGVFAIVEPDATEE